MRYIEIINHLKEISISVAAYEKTIYPSRIIAICIYRYKNGYVDDFDILNRNNPYGQKNPLTLEKMVFESLYDGLINSINDNFIIQSLDEDEITSIIKSWSLEMIDLIYIRTFDKHIIDLNVDEMRPFIDQYTVKRNNEILLTTFDIEEAKKVALANNGYIVNSTGDTIDIVIKSVPSARISTQKINVGSGIVCHDINLYSHYNDTSPSRLISGSYYIHSSKTYNGMYEICKKTISNGTEIHIPLGYVFEKDILNTK